MHSPLVKLAVASLVLIQPSTAAPPYHDSDLTGLIRGSHLAERSQQAPNAMLAASAQSKVGAKFAPAEYPSIDGDCSPLPPGTGPTVTPDTPEAFQDFGVWKELAFNATTPEGYDLQLVDEYVTLSDEQATRLGVIVLNSYDTQSCATACDGIEECEYFNIAVIRSSSLNVNDQQCPNPPSVSRYACSLLGAAIDVDAFPDDGFWWADFHTVIAGSNVYGKLHSPNDEETSDDQSEEDDEDSEDDDDKKKTVLSRRDCNGAPVIRNGGFEKDDPSRTTTPTNWNITNVTPAVAFGFTKPGSINSGGTYAFLANMLAPDTSVEYPSTTFILSQELNTCAGHKYTISFDHRYDDRADGNCTLAISVGPDTGDNVQLVSSGGAEPPHEWITSRYDWLSTTPNDLLALLFICSGHVWNNWSLDNVVVDIANEPDV